MVLKNAYFILIAHFKLKYNSHSTNYTYKILIWHKQLLLHAILIISLLDSSFTKPSTSNLQKTQIDYRPRLRPPPPPFPTEEPRGPIVTPSTTTTASAHVETGNKDACARKLGDHANVKIYATRCTGPDGYIRLSLIWSGRVLQQRRQRLHLAGIPSSAEPIAN